MKKTLLVILFAVFAVGIVSAQNEGRQLNKRYFNLNFSVQKYGTDVNSLNSVISDLKKLKNDRSDWGAGFSTGRTFTLTGDGILNFLHIGIDATWFDVNIAHFKAANRYQSDLAVGLGASIHLTPIGKLGIHTYARYNPTLVTLSDYKRSMSLGYASGIVAGAAISWGTISLGAEARVNIGTYSKTYLFDKDDLEDSSVSNQKYKLNTTGARIYLGFRW